MKLKYLKKCLFFSLFLFFWTVPVLAEGVAVEVGNKAPAFLTITSEGKLVSLYGRYIGKKPVILVFWATWCPSCEREISHLNRLQSHFGERLSVLAINVGIGGDSAEKVQAYKKKYGMNYPVVFDENSRISSEYKIIGTPTQIVISADGTILYRGIRTPPIATLEKNWALLMAK